MLQLQRPDTIIFFFKEISKVRNSDMGNKVEIPLHLSLSPGGLWM